MDDLIKINTSNKDLPSTSVSASADRPFLSLAETTVLPHPGPNDIKEQIIGATAACSFILTFGLIGNILSFTVFNRNTMSVTTTSVYLRFLAIIDSLSLVFNCIFMTFKFYIGFVKLSQPVLKYFVCAFIFHGSLSFQEASSWLIVAMTIDRGIFIFFPTKAKLICTKSRSVIICILIILFFLIFFHPFYYLTGDVEIFGDPNDKWVTNPHCKGTSNSSTVFLYDVKIPFDALMYCIIPSITLLMINTALIVHVIQTTKRRKNLTLDNSKKRPNDRTFQLTVTLICVSLYFFVATFPSFYKIFLYFLQKRDEPPKHQLYIITVTIIGYTNSAVNFYIYCLTGSKFRRELKKLVKGDISYNSPIQSSTSGHISTHERSNKKRLELRSSNSNR